LGQQLTKFQGLVLMRFRLWPKSIEFVSATRSCQGPKFQSSWGFELVHECTTGLCNNHPVQKRLSIKLVQNAHEMLFWVVQYR